MPINTRVLTLLAGSEETRKTLDQQLNEIIGDFITIQSFSVDAKKVTKVNNQLVVLSSYLIEEEAKPYIGDNCVVLVARRIVNFTDLEKMYLVPEGEQVLYVNDFPETVHEAISSFEILGINHLNFIPYYPGKIQKEQPRIAITPGELDLVPDFVEEVINIGPRLIDITTIISILNRLGLQEEKQDQVSSKYIKTITRLSKKLGEAHQEAIKISDHLKKVVNGVNDGILAVNKFGKITVFNDVMERLFKLPMKRAIELHVSEVIFHEKFRQFIFSHERDAYFTVNGTDVVAHRFMIDPDGTVVVTIKDTAETIEMEKQLHKELLKRGYYGKYAFDHIVGQHKEIIYTKQIAKKLAKTELTILIQGESGTGKELFASSIHNTSPRKNGPFLAVNFSALPEDLVESELFGYEEGAFSGAKKGGRKGLFEQANGGTIFLDEIGDCSLKVQTRLLRVLQEKELLRIGGNKIIPVDVRVIAATNKDLLELIDAGKFREDLYHRLKVLFLQLPVLRERKEDIPLLVNHFIDQSDRKLVKVQPDVFKKLMEYEWYGNVRELRNTIEYMLAVCENNIIKIEDIPNREFFQRKKQKDLSTKKLEFNTEIPMQDNKRNDLTMLLNIIYQFQKSGIAASRSKIALETTRHQLLLTEQQVRHRLNVLESKGLIEKSKGRGGTKLTGLGIEYVRTEVEVTYL